MAKAASATYIDGAHNVIKANAGTITYTLCSAQPTTRTEAVTTFMLASTRWTRPLRLRWPMAMFRAAR